MSIPETEYLSHELSPGGGKDGSGEEDEDEGERADRKRKTAGRANERI